MRLVGEDGIKRLQNAFVGVYGLGGVGGHCTEALARAGIGRLHIVDADVVDASNLNRQLIATKRTVGMKKVDAMQERIEDVSDCKVTKQQVFILPDTAEDCVPEGLGFIVDAVDTVSAKLALVRIAKERNIPIVSCMGAGNRLDPSQFYVTDLFETSGCGLARVMRREVRKMGIQSLPVVCSHEPAMTPIECEQDAQQGAVQKKCPPGSLSCVPAAAGLVLAGFVIGELIKGDL